MSSENISIEIFSGQAKNKPKMDEVAQHFLDDLQKEQTRLKEYFPICNLLIEEAYDRVYSWGQIPGHDYFADVMKLKPIKLLQRVFVPIQDYPQSDLNKTVLKLKQNIKCLESETQCQIFIKGRHSMCDEDREEELRLSKDPRFRHLNKELFLEITTEATAIDCHTRIAYALSEIRKYLLKQTNNELKEIQTVDLPTSNIEHIKIEHFEETPFDIDYKEPQLSHAKPLDTISESSDSNSANPIDIGLANKLIKLLDDTLLNPEFKKSGNDKNMLPSQVEPVVDPINVNLDNDPLPVADPINASLDNEMENMPTTSAAAKTKLIKKKSSSDKLKRVGNRRISKDSSKTKSFKLKMDKLKAIKDKNSENATQVKKQKYPGIFYIKDPETDKIVIRKFSNISSLFDYVKNPIKNAFNLLSTDISEDAYKPFTVEYLQQHPQQLLFEITPREIIQFLLESMSGYPVLWEFHKDFYNKEYIKAIESLCELVNEKWSLNIEPLQMCRSITRIFRFYRFLFPFDTIKTFAEYFEKCAGFLPAATIEIPHSRCAHCFCCFQRDKELRTHLCTQHKSLKWSYKCLHCCEEFNTLQDFEFHKRLPHYLEAFICTQCNKKHVGYKDYKRHTHNRKADVPRKYICNICQKAFKSNSELKVHKVYHAEKQFHCDQCSCKYYTKTALSEHMKKHRNEPMFICDICGIRQSSRKSFKEHLESHGDVKVTCNICNLKIRKYSLLRHLRTIHVPCEGSIEETFRGRGQRYKKGEGSRIFNPNYTKRKRRPADKPRKYDCKVCNILFDRLKDLLEHNRQCHTDRVQKLPCKMCDITVAYTTSLKRHYRGIHKLAEYQIFAIVDKYMDVNTVLEMTPNQALVEFIK